MKKTWTVVLSDKDKTISSEIYEVRLALDLDIVNKYLK